MRWKKHGLVWSPDGSAWWARSHAAIPTPLVRRDGTLRMYVQCRDEHSVGRVGYVDLDPERPTRVVRAGAEPVLDRGADGGFDDNGVCATSIVRRPDGSLLMYYVGFEICHRIRYRLLTGVAVSHDDGDTFTRLRGTPVLERSDAERFFRCGPFCLPDDGIYKLWYIGGSDWTEQDGKQVPVYDLRYLESPDGLAWAAAGQVAMALQSADEHGFGRPWVVKRGPRDWQMFYSVRRRSFGAYRLGYAESNDGVAWTRRDEAVGMDVTPGGFDSDAIMYCAPVRSGGRTWCFYNGNNFGERGFGVAELQE